MGESHKILARRTDHSATATEPPMIQPRPDPTAAERQSRLSDGKRSGGYARLCAWIPQRLLRQLKAARRPDETQEQTVARVLTDGLAAPRDAD
jgi:hypothetical protein